MWMQDVIEILIAIALVLLNGFFVAAEFALVKVRGGQVDELVRAGRPFARTGQWLVERMEGALSACQLGITMASLALGWVGEPAFAHLLRPLLETLGMHSEAVLHTTAFVIAFSVITSLHLVIGEQAPKIFAIRRADQVLLWCALPLKWFYLLTYPMMVALNVSTAFLLKQVGLEGESEHDAPHSEDELRALLRQSHVSGHLSRSEHRLLHAVFEFDDMVCRRIMVPRVEVEFFGINDPPRQCIELARRTKHTRYPICNNSLDEVLGVIHVKDLVGLEVNDAFDWNTIMRPPRKVPENMPISKLLRHFQATHQLMAFVVDEYGTVIGIVTLENVLEQIIGEVDDEFDNAEPNIVSQGANEWLVLGTTPVDEISRYFKIALDVTDADTFSGVLVNSAQRLLSVGDRIELGEYIVDVVEVRDDRAALVRVTRPSVENSGPPEDSSQSPDP
ncbi:Magnesium and cobalt efflux protein CorC [Symmachiella dynata]|uniref:Magnesium and cobalt efflux protein CorC n=2 Tax=Symmachiella dynata TaxID=2527995 RepID=A0A517ZN54_9PLAN|nr:Magnesium and cobalt efflux protein CorC [Symmachiella dynata]